MPAHRYLRTHFLIVPVIIFIHKQLHINENHYRSHFKTEKYVNVDTSAIWDNFRTVTKSDKIEQDTVGRNQLLNQHPSEGFASNFNNQTVEEFVTDTNQTNQHATLNDDETGNEFTENDGVQGFDDLVSTAEKSSSVGVNSTFLIQGSIMSRTVYKMHHKLKALISKPNGTTTTLTTTAAITSNGRHAKP